MKKILEFLLSVMLLVLRGCGGTEPCQQTNDTPDMDTADAGDEAAGVQYDYQLKAGEQTEVYDVMFEEMVIVTVDPDSTRDGHVDLRSSIYFDHCAFNGGLTIVGDYHVMVTFGRRLLIRRWFRHYL